MSVKLPNFFKAVLFAYFKKKLVSSSEQLQQNMLNLVWWYITHINTNYIWRT